MPNREGDIFIHGSRSATRVLISRMDEWMTKGERREKRRENNRKMVMDGRGAFAMRRMQILRAKKSTR